MTPTTLPVFFDARMVAAPRSYSPSPRKPILLLEELGRLGLPFELHAPTPVSVDELARVHDRGFVVDVLACRRADGFGQRSAEVAASLPWTSGAMLSAARFALRTGRPTLAPCSGFHHARTDRAADFCTFNGLMVTAAALHDQGVGTLGILDADMHFGDGTEEILERLGRPAWVRHYTVGAHYTTPAQATAFLADLPGIVEGMGGCDLLLYQAGADPHVDDPLGGFLTTAQLAQRDRVVFAGARALGLPVAWNLAGGYQRDAQGGIAPVLEIHANTVRVCLQWAGPSPGER